MIKKLLVVLGALLLGLYLTGGGLGMWQQQTVVQGTVNTGSWWQPCTVSASVYR